MFVSPIRSSKHVWKAFTKCPCNIKAVQETASTIKKQNRNVLQSAVVHCRPTLMCDNANTNNVLLSNIHRELLSLREQVTHASLIRRADVDASAVSQPLSHPSVPPLNLILSPIPCSVNKQSPGRPIVSSVSSDYTSLTSAPIINSSFAQFSSCPSSQPNLSLVSKVNDSTSLSKHPIDVHTVLSAQTESIHPTPISQSLFPLNPSYITSPLSVSTALGSVVQNNAPSFLPLSEELLAARDSDTDSELGESSAVRAMSGSFGASISGGLGSSATFTGYMGAHFRHSSLTLSCDNRVVVDVLNSGTTRYPDMLMVLKVVILLELRLDVRICAVHFPGTLNIIANYLSCMQSLADFLR